MSPERRENILGEIRNIAHELGEITESIQYILKYLSEEDPARPLGKPSPLNHLFKSEPIKIDPAREALQGEKPPPIQVSVSGIDASRVGEIGAPAEVNWPRLAAYPPFQMFVRERSPASILDSFDLAVMYLHEHAGEAMIRTYEEWFHAKGFWPGESALGEPR